METKISGHFVAVIAVLTIVLVGYWTMSKDAEAPESTPDVSAPENTGEAARQFGGEIPAIVPVSAPSTETKLSPGATFTPAPVPPPAPAPRTPAAKTAPEITGATFYINTLNDPVSIASYKGKKVVLLEFWTYSNVNSRRTIPHLNEWYRKYREKGLEIVAVHTPEFDFEKDHTAVKNMSIAYGMSYPVVVDNNGLTSKAYGNTHWPHYYVIDIDGKIVYDHVGEGGYDTAEAVIQRLLGDRSARLDLNITTNIQIAPPADAILVDAARVKTPELYFGASKNARQGNGEQSKIGPQTLTLPATTIPNTFTLGGTWNWGYQYAETKTEKAQFTVMYDAKRVYGVFAAPKSVRVVVTRDGNPLAGSEAGRDVVFEQGKSVLYVSAGRLYEIVGSGADYGPHKLEFMVDMPGLQAFVVRFG